MIYKVATMMAMFGAAAAEHWAVIVAGSSGYGNYRHQADACHAYQPWQPHRVSGIRTCSIHIYSQYIHSKC